MWRRLDNVAAPWLRTRMVLSSSAALAGYLRSRGDFDLLHVEVAYPFGASAMLAAAASRWPGPIAITPMGEDTLLVPECHYGFRRHLAPRWLVDHALERAACIRCISPLHERVLARLAPKVPRRVIPLNVSNAVIGASQESAEARAIRRRNARAAVDVEFDAVGRPLILSLGRLHPFKGIDLLVGALRQVPDALLLVAGPSLRSRASGDERTRLARLADSLGIADRVRFLGPTSGDRALQLMAAADVVAVPSRLESLNKVCVEAVAVGTPFVVTDTTGIEAWARKANVGIVVPAQQEDALAAGLIDAIGRGPLDPGCIKGFVDQFSPRTVAAAVVEFYRDVLGRG
jgi:glycosyltransferase involved in cell wall biosynthesis